LFSIKETRRSCSSTTLQWLKAADADTRYCLYRRKETVHYLEELVSKHANLCSGKMPETDLVGCYTHFADRQMNVNQPSKGYLSVADDYSSDDIDGIIETTDGLGENEGVLLEVLLGFNNAGAVFEIRYNVDCDNMLNSSS
uniref:Protein NDNF C-terminal domain-containing protein n=1 Tax=Parascaris equorum TaxID=6256 RepID=A0A914S8J0_PAREQ